jgi:NADH-quinone oxidoreductase subunit N
VRVIVLMYFSDPAESGPTIAVPSVLTTAAVTVGAAVTLVLGLAPQFLLDLADKAAHLVG